MDQRRLKAQRAYDKIPATKPHRYLDSNEKASSPSILLTFHHFAIMVIIKNKVTERRNIPHNTYKELENILVLPRSKKDKRSKKVHSRKATKGKKQKQMKNKRKKHQ